MQKQILSQVFILLVFLSHLAAAQLNPYKDKAYLQDYSVKYYLPDSTVSLSNVRSDRNGIVYILSSKGILKPNAGKFQYPGNLKPDRSYKPVLDRHVKALSIYNNQLVYLDSNAVFSNAFAGEWLTKHGLPQAHLLCTGPSFTSVVSDGKQIRIFTQKNLIWEGDSGADSLLDIKYDALRNRYLFLSKNAVQYLSPGEKELKTGFKGSGFTCFDIDKNQLFVGSENGYMVFDADKFVITKPLTDKLPVSFITSIHSINGKLWFGTNLGAFMQRADGKYNYYFGERWLPSNHVTDISQGENGNILVLTSKGLGEIHFDPMTLEQKALVYEKQVRERHIRYGFNSDIASIVKGDLSTAQTGQRDSDNLWTSMYLVSQLFRYKVTGSKEALQNCMESFEAMERLFDITGIKGFFARGFERKGYHKFSNVPWDGGMTNGWVHASDAEWDWRGTTSSDQTVGQMFTLTLMAELMDGPVKQRAINLMDKLMTNIIENDWYLIDFDGKPTLWAKWNPDYVNSFSKNIGDRKLNSSNIIGFLQAAYHFTGKPIYKQKAYELINKYGYLENLTIPMANIGQADSSAGDWAKMLSEGWNHSDDEMYFLAYWCLYPYAFDLKLKEKYKIAIRQHWELERPEKDGLWNLCYAMTGAKAFDLNETIWYLKEFPLDMIEWKTTNSHRKDIEPVAPNFRGQTTKEVLPPDERPELKHNRNLFKLDADTNGNTELSAGDTFLLPYWMGRYLGVITSGEK